MADLAFVFHWMPDAMASFTVADLMAWRTRAAVRHNPEEKTDGP